MHILPYIRNSLRPDNSLLYNRHLYSKFRVHAAAFYEDNTGILSMMLKTVLIPLLCLYLLESMGELFLASGIIAAYITALRNKAVLSRVHTIYCTS